MSDENNKLELTRRKILGAAGTVGVAGAGVGLGTSALFSDEESYVNNTITAGELDMIVNASVPTGGINDEWAGAVNFSGYGPEEADGEPVMGVTLGDMKPGDWVLLCYDITVETNPSCLSLGVTNTANDDNGLTEPEENEGGDSTGGNGEGDLAQNLEVTVYNDLNESALDGTLAGAKGALTNELLGGVTLQDVWTTFDGGGAIAADTQSFDFYLLLVLPSDVGNVVQSDSVEWDFVFDAVQSRNNECDTPVWEDGGDTPTVTLPADKNYIGYEDLPDGGDFDYNDFGMDADITETYSGGTLDTIEMEFTSLEHTAGYDHEIHIERTLDSNVTYDLDVSRPNHTAQGGEKPAGTYQGLSGMLDVVLFDTDFFSSGDEVTLTVTITSGSVTQPTSSPRPDVAANNPLFEVYDPYMQYGSTRIDLGTIQDNVGAFDTESDVPNIIVVPDPNFTPPGAQQNIQTPYPEFDDYYGNGGGDNDGDLDVDPTYDEWYTP